MMENMPFGPADSSNVDFSLLSSTYISMLNRSGNIRTSIDPSVRVIFGKKGSGKTLYLRAIVDYLKNQIANSNSNYVTDIENQPPSSYLISKVDSWFNDQPKKGDELWRDIWKVVILQTAATHVLYSKEFESHFLSEQKSIFKKRYKKILPNLQVKSSIFNQLTSLLESFNSETDLQRFINNQLWGGMESEISEVLKNSPPMYFFLDQLDDDFTSQPNAWLSCQYGLFRCIFRMIRSPNTYGRRLHVVVCLREFVYAYVLNNAHGGKVFSEPKIISLEWNRQTSTYFLRKKIESLPKRFMINSTSENSISNFFGNDKISTRRGEGICSENVEDYIMRHIMLMPREIINIGNKYYQNRTSIINIGDSIVNLRESVRNVAKQIALEQLKMAALLISTRWIYKGAFEDGTDNIYNEEYFVGGVQNSLENLIKSINRDRFSRTVLVNRIKRKGDFNFSTLDRPFNALYRSGLIGYVHENVNGDLIDVFFSESRESQYDFPVHNKEYVFHSCLIDHLKIKPSKRPVYAQF